MKRRYTVKKEKRLGTSPSPAGCQLSNSPWVGRTKFFPSRESLVSDIPAGEGNVANLFFTVYLRNRSVKWFLTFQTCPEWFLDFFSLFDEKEIRCKKGKKVRDIPVPSRVSIIKLSLGWKNKIFPVQEEFGK
jgi:hypothetical protein